MSNVRESLELPLGFRWAAASGAIKKTGRLDVGMMVADHPCSTAAVFTRNAFCAAPVVVSRAVLQQTGGMASGVAVNSGCANAATGEEGMRNAQEMAGAAARACGVTGEFLVCSTGTIGVQLPMERLLPALGEAGTKLSAANGGFSDFAHSILTTDTRKKVASARFSVGGKTARIVACAKGSGMIYPRMATLLCFVATDVAADPIVLKECFSDAVERSLNCITVDADTSTNDTAIVMASGLSGLYVARGSDEEMQFEDHLLEVLQSIAKQLARDGEGATKLIEVAVTGCPSFKHARTVALAIANSNLVKTAIYGRDANWGRIVCAIGNADPSVDPQKVTVRLGPLTLFELGAPLPLDEDAALRVLSEDTVRIEADLGNGMEEATAWTCDLTEKYIEINGSYRT